ncbi:MAG: M56 family metallopeptidase [Gemmatimonadaceae bacterium]|nr:M56 family metallopeptidase [Gemmatimonadaceae bacterium]
MSLIVDRYPLLLAGWGALSLSVLAWALLAPVSGAAVLSDDPARRYAVLTRRLAAAVALVPATGLLLNREVAQAVRRVSAEAMLAPASGDTGILRHALDASAIEGALLVLGVAWLAGLVWQMVRLGAGLRWERRVRRSVRPAPPALQRRLDDACGRLGLSQRVLIGTGPVDSPMLIGRVTPIIVVPRFRWYGSEAHCDALLLHELAHLQRGDRWSNVAILAAATLLWWHPSVRHTIRTAQHDREFACDDVVAQQGGASQALAEALVALADVRRAAIGTGTALTATAHPLVARVHRLLDAPGASRDLAPALPSRRSRWMASPALVTRMLLGAVPCCMIAVAASAHERTTRSFARSWMSPPTLITVRAVDPAGTFALAMRRGRVEHVTMDSSPVSPSRVTVAGDSVAIRDPSGARVLTLALDPRGAIRWDPRPAPAHGTTGAPQHPMRLDKRSPAPGFP